MSVPDLNDEQDCCHGEHKLPHPAAVVLAAAAPLLGGVRPRGPTRGLRADSASRHRAAARSRLPGAGPARRRRWLPARPGGRAAAAAAGRRGGGRGRRRAAQCGDVGVGRDGGRRRPGVGQAGAGAPVPLASPGGGRARRRGRHAGARLDTAHWSRWRLSCSARPWSAARSVEMFGPKRTGDGSSNGPVVPRRPRCSSSGRSEGIQVTKVSSTTLPPRVLGGQEKVTVNGGPAHWCWPAAEEPRTASPLTGATTTFRRVCSTPVSRPWPPAAAARG